MPTKYEEYNFTIPTWSLCYFINGDLDNLDERDLAVLKQFEGEYPNIIIPCPNEDQEAYFCSHNDIDGNLGGNVYDLDCLVPIVTSMAEVL